MSPVAFNFAKGIDLPSWHWLNQCTAGQVRGGSTNAYDGSRYIYWALQVGSASAASTTQLWRFDTWTNGWQYMWTLTSAWIGQDLEYDPVRNVLWLAEGNNTSVWRFFNLNAAAVTLAGQTINPWSLSAAISVVLPAAATTGASFVQVEDAGLSLAPIDGSGRTAGAATASSTASSIVDAAGEFQAGLVGCYVRFTSGARSGEQRIITAVPSVTTLTVAALTGAPAAADAFVIEPPGFTVGLTATGGTTTTLVRTGEAWPVNQYRDADAVILSGTGAGQRRRIASNTVDTLTLAGAVTGNARTGNWAAPPDATSVFKIVPSSDFMYLFVGTTTFYRTDVAATTIAWTTYTASIPGAPAASSNVIPNPAWAPFSIVLMRGGNVSGNAVAGGFYRYDIGLQTWAQPVQYWGQEAFNAGTSFARVPGRPRILIQQAATPRIYYLRVHDGVLEPGPLMPYANPSTQQAKLARVVRVDGVEWAYVLRNDGQEFFRVPTEWL